MTLTSDAGSPASVLTDPKELMMSITQNTDRDQLVAAELEKLSTTTTTGDYFARALELGATPAYLARIAHSYTQKGDDDWTVVALPYVHDLLDAGWSNAQVRQFLHDQCFSYDSGPSHREGFWNDPGTWDVFDDADTFVAFMKHYAATSEGAERVLTEDGHNLLESALVMWRDTPQQWQRDVREIEAVAASHLTFIEDEYQLNQVIRYAIIGRDDRKAIERLAMRANESAYWGWSLVLRGYALAKLPYHSYEYSLVSRGIDQTLSRKPEEAAVKYRWLAEGFWRLDAEFGDMRLERSDLQAIFSRYGWHFARVTQTQRGTQQATFKIKGQQVIVRHVPDSEPLAPGDDVMLHDSELADSKSRYTPAGKTYELTLTPARRPTPEQLADFRSSFHPKK